jgi:hypothetical protein
VRQSRRLRGAEAFVASLGDASPAFAASLTAPEDAAALDAEATIAASPPAVASVGAGGVLHYRRHYPDDAHLALWAALVLEAQGAHALAAGELARARRLGLAAPRVDGYLARVLRALGAAEAVPA